MPDTDPWMTPPSSFGKRHDWDGTADRPIVLMEQHMAETRQDSVERGNDDDDESRVIRSVVSGSCSDEELLGDRKKEATKTGLRAFLGGVRNTLQGRKKREDAASPVNSDQEEIEAKISDDIVDVQKGGLQAFASNEEQENFHDEEIVAFDDSQFANVFRKLAVSTAGDQVASVRSPSPSRLELLARDRKVSRRSRSPRNSNLMVPEPVEITPRRPSPAPPVRSSSPLQLRAMRRKNAMRVSSPQLKVPLSGPSVETRRERSMSPISSRRSPRPVPPVKATYEPSNKTSSLSARGRDLYFANKKSQRKEYGDSSDKALETITLDDSLNSDIRRLRTILRRSRQKRRSIEPSDERILVSRGPSADYLTAMADDPMHRAGLRLLTAAVIPIQCAVRRHFALREALSRMWAIVVVQTTFRAYRARCDFRVNRHAAVLIQSVFRGARVREDLLVQHCCAMEIQRHIRGYLATLRTFERIYKITLVQSVVRRKLAVDNATDRMVLVIQLQSIIRRFLVGKRLAEENAAATKIQANWRSFSCSFNYELDMVDIVTVQSLIRRRLAMTKLQKLRNAKYGRYTRVIQHHMRGFADRQTYRRQWEASVVIQSHWRAFHCSLNYLHFVADVIIVQSVARRFLVNIRLHKERYVKEHAAATKISSMVRVVLSKRVLRDIAATKIQASWRRFIGYADYIFALADIVVVQSLARRWLMRDKLESKRRALIVEALNLFEEVGKEEVAAATMIQKHWRGFITSVDYDIYREEHFAAVSIQNAWRKFWCFSNYIISLDSIVRIQAVFRGYLAYRDFEDKLGASMLIQTAARGFQGRQYVRVHRCALSLIEQSRVSSAEEAVAATAIQSVVRGGIARYFVRFDKSALHIQSLWRGYYVRNAQSYCKQARTIQKVWRGRQAFIAYRSFLAARRIQKVWRGRQTFIAVTSFLAARRIQKVWRSKVVRNVFRKSVAALRIQTCWRRDHHQVRFASLLESFRLRRNLAAVMIQRWTRGHLVRRHLGAFTTSVHALRFRASYAKEIQRVWRGFHCRMRYWRMLGSALQIQRAARGFMARKLAGTTMQQILKAQSVARVFLARLEAKQRFIITLLMQQRSSSKQLKLKASTSSAGSSSDWLGISKQQQRVDRAARTIQKFFKMVKKEVDREIRAAKRRHRHRSRRRVKQSSSDHCDDTLENVWRSYSMTSEKSKSLHQTSMSSAAPLSELNRRSTKNRIPPKTYPRIYSSHTKKVPKLYVRTSYEDDTSTILSSPTVRSRLSPQELDMDYKLETAFIDAEILNAKKRRKHRKKQTVLV